MTKVFIIDGNTQYRAMFERMGWEITTDLLKADLVQFTGGADVSPFLYGEVMHRTTYHDPRRDLVESGYYAHCVRMGIKMAGICRGGQFLNVMNGGSMFQNVDGHAIHGTHPCTDLATGEVVQVTSTHHQMMVPGVGAVVLAEARESSFKAWMDKEMGEVIMDGGEGDVEAVFYPDTKSLCFQPHPEFYGADSTREYYFELINRYLGM